MTILLQAPIQNPVIKGLIGKTEDQAGGILGNFFSSLVGLLLVGATIWAFLQLLLGGFSWITAGGDKGKLETAQQKILQAIVGLGIVFASWAIYLVILRFLGFTDSTTGGFTLPLPKLL